MIAAPSLYFVFVLWSLFLCTVLEINKEPSTKYKGPSYGITRTSSPSATCVTPVVITTSPGFTPLLIATELPYDSPSVTVRKRATFLPAVSSITNTAYAFGSAFDRVIDVKGTTGTSVDRSEE